MYRSSLTLLVTTGVQLWSKPMAVGKVAFLVLNPLSIPQTVKMPLTDVPGNPCSSGSGSRGKMAAKGCKLRDVWAGAENPAGESLAVSLGPHESLVYILSATTAPHRPAGAILPNSPRIHPGWP